jgi:hypothetical protein
MCTWTTFRSCGPYDGHAASGRRGGVKRTKSKRQFGAAKIEFRGRMADGEGLEVRPRGVDALTDAPLPQRRAFLGAANRVGATSTTPLWRFDLSTERWGSTKRHRASSPWNFKRTPRRRCFKRPNTGAPPSQRVEGGFHQRAAHSTAAPREAGSLHREDAESVTYHTFGSCGWWCACEGRVKN